MEAIVAAKLPHRIVAELSTFSLDDKAEAEEQLRAAGHTMLDCPLSGTGSQARTKDLVVYASGDAQAINGLMPLFADFSRQAHDLGAFGNGMKMKFVANLLVAIHNVASAEAMVLGMKAGLDPAQIFKLIQSGAGNSRVFELRAPMMVEDRYDGDNLTMRVSTWQKDMKVIGEYAASVGCPTPLFSASEPIYRAALSTGHADEDTGSVCAVLEAMAGIEAMTEPKARSRASATRYGETRDGMRIDWDVPIAMDDGLVLRADVFRPIDGGQAIRSSSPTAPTRRASRSRTAIRARGSAWWTSIPTSRRARRNLYQSWEVVDPEKWVPRRLRLRARRFARRRPLARLTSITSRRARPRTSTTASSGPACSRGRTARSGSTASRTTPSTSGTSPRCSRRTSPRCASGKARPTGTAT